MELGHQSIGKFVALGGWFKTHGDRTYRWPDLWVVPPEAIINEEDPIQLPDRVEEVTPASELAAVIGEELWQASESEAWDAIEGFTVSNDVTATGDWPGWSDPDFGMITGVGYKIFPTFSPILSEYVPKKEQVSEYDDLLVEVRVDGEVVISESTREQAFSIPELLSFASHIVKLRPNDVVSLGDPGNPSTYLDDADEVVCTVETIGELRNPIERL